MRNTRRPFYGSRRMTAVLRRAGYAVNRKRVMRLMRQLGLAAIYPKPALSQPDSQLPGLPVLAGA
jgi:putative transposase